MNVLLNWLTVIAEEGAPGGMVLAVKLTLLLVLGWLIHAALRTYHPRWRVLLWRTIAAGTALLILMALSPPLLNWPVLPAEDVARPPAISASSPEISRIEPAVGDAQSLPIDLRPLSENERNAATATSHVTTAETAEYPASASGPLAAGSTPTSSASEPKTSIFRILFAIWYLGALAGVVRLSIGLWRLNEIRRTAGRVPAWVEDEARAAAAVLKLPHRFDIRQTDQLQTPCVVGVLRPLVLMPDHQCRDELREEAPSILAHELSHMQRLDLVWNALLNGLSIVLWFHPFVWRVRLAHADACDACSDIVAADYVGSGALYARTLARLTLRIAGREMAVGLAMARASHVQQRIEAIRRNVFETTVSRATARWAAALALTAVTLIGGVALTRSQAAPLVVDAVTPDAASSVPESVNPNAAPADEKKSSVIETQVAAVDASGGSTPEATAKADEPTASEPGVVTGEVVRADDGAPVAGVLVLLREGRLYRATTDEQGRFRFEKTPPGQYAIWAHKDELASPKERVVGRPTADSERGQFAPIRLTVKRGKQVRFMVKSGNSGAAVGGAEIRFGYPDRRKTTTDAGGTAVVAALLPETYNVTVDAPGHTREVRELDLRSAADTLEQSYALRPGGVVRGTVTDESGKPLAKVGVTYYTGETSYWDHGSAFTSDDQGQFSHFHLPLGKPVKVAARLQDYLPLEKEILLTDNVSEGTLEFRLQPRPRGGSITGIVLDSEEKPLAGATVRNVGNGTDQKREATTDAEGRFALNDLLEGLNGTEIIVRAQKYATTMQKVRPGTEDSPNAVTVRMEKGHTIRGRVVGPSGGPVKGAYVAANGFGDWGIGETVRTDDEGMFEFDSLPSATKFMIQGLAFPIIHDRELKLDGAETVVVTLESYVTLAGRVVDAETGKPVEDFRLRGGFSRDRRPGDSNGSYPNALGEPGMIFQSKAGEFLVNEMTKGVPVEIVVEANGYERAVFPRVVAGTDEADKIKQVALKKRDVSKLATLTGKAVDHRGQPGAGVQLRLIVTAEPSSGNDDNNFNWSLIQSGQLAQKSYVDQYLSAVTDAQGAFQFGELPPARFLQIAYWGDNVPKGRSLALAKTKPGANQSITLTLPESARITGSFDLKLFPDVGEIQVNFEDETFLTYHAKPGDKKDTFALENLPQGKCYVRLTSLPERLKENPNMSTVRTLASRKLTIEPGKTYEVQFTKEDIEKPR